MRRDTRFGDRPGARYARYRCADPFVAAWFRFVRPNCGALQGTPAGPIWDTRIAPALDDWMGPVTEEMARQAFVRGHLGDRVGPVDEVAPFWSRDGRTEIDLVVRSGGRLVFVECKWGAAGRVDLAALRQLRDHVARLPDRIGRRDHRLCVVAGGGFSARLKTAAAAEDVLLVDLRALLA